MNYNAPLKSEQIAASDVRPGDVLLNTLFPRLDEEHVYVHDVVTYTEQKQIGFVTDCGVAQFNHLVPFTRVATRKIAMSKDICMLATSGVTHTTDAAFDWAQQVVRAARSWLHDSLVATVWAYRDEALQGLSCDITDAGGACYSINLVFAGRNELAYDDHGANGMVYDAAEALHLVGMVLRGVGANVQLGCFDAEGNSNLITSLASPGRTVGRMAIAGADR